MNSLEISALAEKAFYFYQTENPEKAYLFARFAAFEAAKSTATKSHKNAAEIAATVAVSKELLKTFVALQFSASFSSHAQQEGNLTGQYLRQDLVHVHEIEKSTEESLSCKLIANHRDNINELTKKIEEDYFNQFPATDVKNRFALKDAVAIYPVAFASALAAFVQAEKETRPIKNPVHREVRFKNLVETRLRCELQDKTPSNWQAIHYAAAAGTAIGTLLILAGSSLIALPLIGFTILPTASLLTIGSGVAIIGTALGVTGTGILAHGFFSEKPSYSEKPNADKPGLIPSIHSL